MQPSHARESKASSLPFSIPCTHYVTLFVEGGWGETDEEEEGGRHSSRRTWTVVTGLARMRARHLGESLTEAVPAIALKIRQQSSSPPRGAARIPAVHRGVKICMIYTSCRYERVWEDRLMVIVFRSISLLEKRCNCTSRLPLACSVFMHE